MTPTKPRLAILLCVFTHKTALRARRPVLIGSLTCAIVLGAAAASPAGAATPEQWESVPDVSVLGFLTVLVLIPLGLAAVIALLTLLPSLARDKGYEPGQEWRGEPEWFGGPTAGVQAAHETTPEQIESRSEGTGGTSAHW